MLCVTFREILNKQVVIEIIIIFYTESLYHVHDLYGNDLQL